MSKTCSKCHREKDENLFSRTKKRGAGGWYYNSQCNPCRVEGNRVSTGAKKKRLSVLTSTTKECTVCWSVLPHESFSLASRGSGGLATACKPCNNLRIKDPEKVRQATTKYRVTHRFKYLAAHRVTQYNRKNLIKIVADGTLTEDVLKGIYDESLCCWCKEETPPEERTLEHVRELNNGGIHGVSNCDMACFSCNSKRLNKEDNYVKSDLR